FAADGLVRERLSFNADWRFAKDDPADAAGKLKYSAIKGWILATGAEFTTATNAIKTRPSGNPADVSYAQADFDDSHWRSLNLPHDWGVEGPFKQQYPGKTGKLPWWGVG